MMKYKQVLGDLVDFKIPEFEEIDSCISTLENKIIRKLTMDLETEHRKKIFIAIERS